MKAKITARAGHPTHSAWWPTATGAPPRGPARAPTGRHLPRPSTQQGLHHPGTYWLEDQMKLTCASLRRRPRTVPRPAALTSARPVLCPHFHTYFEVVHQ